MGDGFVAAPVDDRLRRRRQAVLRESGRARLLLFAVLGLLVAVGAGAWWLSRSPSMNVRQISVPVLQHVSPEEMEGALAGALGVNLFRLDVRPLAGELRSIPYVREAAVHRSFPQGLEVEIVEYQPFAVATTEGGAAWLVADDGRILEKASAEVQAATAKPSLALPADLGLAEGAWLAQEVTSCLSILTLVRADGYWVADHPVSSLSITATGWATLVLAGGGEVRLGEQGQWASKLQAAAQVIDTYLAQGRTLEYVDVQIPGRAVAKAKDGGGQ